jgi:alkaline phosphatase D
VVGTNQGWPAFRVGTSSVPHFWGRGPSALIEVIEDPNQAHWANDVKVDYKDPASPVVGSELVCTSIKSAGNCTGSTTDATMAWNPHLKFYNDNRGYVNTRITKDAMTADFRTLDYVTAPGLP